MYRICDYRVYLKYQRPPYLTAFYVMALDRLGEMPNILPQLIQSQVTEKHTDSHFSTDKPK